MSLYGTDLLALLPELIVVVTACLVIVLDPITPASRRDLLAWLSVGALALCLGITGGQISVLNDRMSAFSDLVVIDPYARFWKIVLYGVTGLTIVLSLPYLKAERTHLGEFYGFVLLALSGMMVMVSGADLLTIYLGTELMSLSLYVMTGLNRAKPRSLEAAAKYFVLGAFSSGILLYGISMLYGVAGSTKLISIAGAIGTRGVDDPLVLIATILLAVGFGFKLAAVPFHMWTPDFYEGSPTPITAFISVASKAAGFAVFIRFFLTVFGPLQEQWVGFVAILAAVTMVLGNLVALQQRNFKRMLAYSSIAQAGYLLIGVAAVGELGTAAVLFYLTVYVLTNITAFAVAEIATNATGSELIKDMAGLSRRAPGIAFALLAAMLSLAGVPPLAGFFGKFYIFQAAVGYTNPAGQHSLVWLALLGVLTSIIALYYYLVVLKVAYVDRAEGEDVPLKTSGGFKTALTITVAGMIFFGIFATPLYTLSTMAAQAMR